MFSRRKGTGGNTGPTSSSSKLVMKSKGWKADTYEFQVTVRSVYNLLPGTTRTRLLIKRGSKVAKTQIVDASNGECDFNDEVLTISTSLFVNPRTGEYESKPMLLTVKEITSKTKTRVYAESKIDLMDFCLQPGKEITKTVPLKTGKGEKTVQLTHVQFSVRAIPVAEGVAFSEISSDASIANLSDFDEDDVAEGRKKKRREQDNAELESVLEEEEFEESFVPSVSEDLSPPQRGSDLTASSDVGGARAYSTAKKRSKKANVSYGDDDDDDDDDYQEDKESMYSSEDDVRVNNDENNKIQTGALGYDYNADSAFVYRGEGQNNEIQQAPMQGQLRFENVDGGVEATDTLVPGNRSLRLMVNRNCKINVRVIDRFGNPRARGGDDVEAVVVHTETNERASCKVTDHGDGSYLLDFSCPSAGVWMLRCAYNGRLSNEVHKLVVSHGPLTATDLILDLPQGTQPCGGYAPVRVRIARPEDGRQFSGAEGFQVKLTAPSGVSVGIPIECQPGSIEAVGTICWPEVGENWVSITLDGRSLPGAPHAVQVAPEVACLAASQITGPGAHKCIAGERATFIIETRDQRGNRLREGGFDLEVSLKCKTKAGNDERFRGEIIDFGNGSYEASYVCKVAGNFELVVALGEEELNMKAICEPNVAVIQSCVLLGDSNLDLIVGKEGRVTIQRRDAYGNDCPSRQGQLAFRCTIDGPGLAKCDVIDGSYGRSDVVVKCTIIGRYFVSVSGGEHMDSLPGAPFEIVVTPSIAAGSACVTSIYGAQLASPDSDALVAVAGDEVIANVSPKDIYGNATSFTSDQSIFFTAVMDDEEYHFENRGGPRAEATLSASFQTAGSYLLSADAAEEPLAGYPRILIVVPGATDPSKCMVFGEAAAGVRVGRPSHLTIHAADKFGNLRATGGDVLDMTLVSPDGRSVVTAKVVDHSDGTYGCEFKLDQPGMWDCQLVVNGQTGRSDVQSILAEYGPVIAQECSFVGLGSDNLGGVVCFENGTITIYPNHAGNGTVNDTSVGRRFNGTEAMTTRILLPSGEVAEVKLTFENGVYTGTYRWTQVGMHTISVNLSQEAIIGSPYNVEILLSLPQIPENLSAREIADMLPNLLPEGAAQALSNLSPKDAADAIQGQDVENVARMLSGVMPGTCAEILSELPPKDAADILGAMRDPTDVLLAMSTEDLAKILANADPEDNAKFLDALKQLSPGDLGPLLKNLDRGNLEKLCEDIDIADVVGKCKDKKDKAGILARLPPRLVPKAMRTLDVKERAEMLEMIETMRREAGFSESTSGDGWNWIDLIAGCSNAWLSDPSLPAHERQTRRQNALERLENLAPVMIDISCKGGCALYEAGFDDADGEDVAVVVYALLLADDTGGVMQTKDETNSNHALSFFRCCREDQRIVALPFLLDNKSFGRLALEMTPEELADLLKDQDSSTVERAFCQVCKHKGHELAANAANLLDPVLAAEAISISLQPDSNCDLSGMFQFLIAEILALIDPLEALGKACEGLMNAHDILGKLSPEDACRALRGMSPDEVTKMLRNLKGGDLDSESSLANAVALYAAGLSPEAAAALIEDIDPNFAISFVSLMPEQMIQNIMKHLKRRDLKDRILNRSTLCLPQCTVKFAEYQCIAGIPAKIVIEAREKGGSRIPHGGAQLSVFTRPADSKLASQMEPIEGEIKDRGNGDYEIIYVSKTAGPIEVVVLGNSEEAIYDSTCYAGDCDVLKSTLDKSGLDEWKAGEGGLLRLQLVDAYGNKIDANDCVFDFKVRCVGPGTVKASNKRLPMPDGRIEFELETNTTGVYTITVSCVDTNEIIPTTPFEASMVTGKLSHAGCKAVLQTLTSSTKGFKLDNGFNGAKGDKSKKSPLVCAAMAGEEVTALVDACDRYGNPTVFKGETVTVSASGPAHLPQERAFEVADMRGGRVILRTICPRAGSYVVHVAVDGIPIAASPLALHVFPGPCVTGRATLRGDALAGVLAGHVSRLTVQTEDKYGNNCHGGGDRVDLSIISSGGNKSTCLDVHDHGDGSYTAEFVVPTAGRYTCSAVINGKVAKESTVELIATYGPVSASGCILRAAPGVEHSKHVDRVAGLIGAGNNNDNVVIDTCGSLRDIYVQSLEFEATGRGMSGKEACSVHLIAPSGASHTLAVSFAERGARYKASARWWEVGRHEIVATINGEPIVGSPLIVDVEAQNLSLPMCRLSGPGLQGAVAGEKATILIEARDARGNRLFTGGALLGLAIRSGGDTTRGKVFDLGDGTYEAAYVVERAGPFELSLFLGSEAATFRANCVPGRVDYAKCRVDGATHTRWIAGQQLAFTVTRVDRFGNRVPRREGLAPLYGYGVGPNNAEVAVESLELGNGTCEIRYTATVAGTYNLGVYVADAPLLPFMNEEAEELMHYGRTEGKTKALPGVESHEGEDVYSKAERQKRIEAKTTEYDEHAKTIIDDKGKTRRILIANKALERDDALAGAVKSAQKKGYDERNSKITFEERTAVAIAGGQSISELPKSLQKVNAADGTMLFPLPRGVFEIPLVAAVAEPQNCDLIVVGARQRNGDDYDTNGGSKASWVAPAGENVLVCVTARDRFGNDTSWEEGQVIQVQAQGPEFFAFDVTGATSRQTDFTSKMTRAGTFELRVLCDGLPVCWRVVQIIAGPTHPDRCFLSMEGLKDVKTGDLVRLTLRAVDQYANLRVQGGDDVQLALEGPNGAYARGASVVDHGDGTYALEFGVTVAGRWILSVRINGQPLIEGGIAFHVAFGTLTAEEADITLNPALDARGAAECGTTTDLIIVGAGFEVNKRLMTGLEAISVVLTLPSGVSESLRCTLAKDMTRYVAKIRWLHPGVHHIAVLINGIRVPKTPIRVIAEGREISLSACVVSGEGATRCIAGEPAKFRLHARDYGGNPINFGAAEKIHVEARCPGESPIAASFVNNQDGTYDFEYVCTKAGKVDLFIALQTKNPSSRTLNCVCEASWCEPSECRVDASKMLVQWLAGEPGIVRVQRRDRYGNPTRRSAKNGLNRFAAEVVGPAVVDCEALELGDGTCELRLRAAASGVYEIDVLAVAIDATNIVDDIAGGGAILGEADPELVATFVAECESTQTFPAACVARIALQIDPLDESAGEERLGEHDSDASLPATIVAGDKVNVYVLPRDAHGNKTQWTGGERIAVHGKGPTEIAFAPGDDVGAFSATFTDAGTYCVSALVGDSSCAGWPRTVQVVAGPADANACIISGEALSRSTTATETTLMLQAADVFGNMRSMGGDLVEATIKTEQDGYVDCYVEDVGDGTYVLRFEMDEPIRHDVHLSVNGVKEKNSRYSLSPSLGVLIAGECVVRGVGGERPELHDTQTLFVQPANPSRVMSGREAIVCTVHTPSGLAFNTPVVFNPESRHFWSKLFWVELGNHSVCVTLDGDILPGCPFVVRVRDPNQEAYDEFMLDARERAPSSAVRANNAFGYVYGTDTHGPFPDYFDWADDNDDDDEMSSTEHQVIFGSANSNEPRITAQQAEAALHALRSQPSLEAAAEMLCGMKPNLAGACLDMMEPEEAASVLAAMQDERALAAAFVAMEEDNASAALYAGTAEEREKILNAISPMAAATLLTRMTAQDAANILSDASAEARANILRSMSPKKAAEIMARFSEVYPHLMRETFGALDANYAARLLASMPNLTDVDPEVVALVLSRVDSDVASNLLWKLQSTPANAEVAAAALCVMAMTDIDLAAKHYATLLVSGKPKSERLDEALRATSIGTKIADLAENLVATGAVTPPPVNLSGEALGGNAASSGEIKEHRWGANGVKPSKSATLRAAKSLEGVPPKVAAQALADMRAAAAGAVLATMDAERAAQIIANMNPKKLAEAISQMELDDAKRVFASCKRGDRANILENLSLEASGSLVGALDPQSAVEALKMIEDENKVMDILRRVKPPSALAAILMQYTADKTAEIFSKLTPQQSASAMSSMFASSQEGARKLNAALALMKPDEVALRLQALLPLDPHAASELLYSMPEPTRSKVYSRMESKDSGKILHNLSPKRGMEILANASVIEATPKTLSSSLESLSKYGPSWANQKQAEHETTKSRGVVADCLLKLWHESNNVHKQKDAEQKVTSKKACIDCLETMDAKVAAHAIGNMTPKDAADIVSALTPETAASILTNMSESKRAAMLLKMTPEAAAACLKYLSLDDASAAIRAILETDDEDAIKRASQILAAADPFRAGEILTSISSNMETVRTAIKNMPSSAVANIFAAGAVEPDIAAKIIDGLDMDIADGIIAALPPANADQICNLVKDDELRNRAADRAIVVLASSKLEGDGWQKATAGIEAEFIMLSTNPAGKRIFKGGAKINCAVYELDIANKRTSKIPIQAKVEDLRDGSYAIRYTCLKASPHELSITCAGQERKARIIVVPGEVDPKSCVVLDYAITRKEITTASDGKKKLKASGDEEKNYEIIKTPLKKYVWRSGDVVEIPMICADKHGNIVPPPKHEDLTSTFAIVADGDGPGTVEADIGRIESFDKNDKHGPTAVARFRATACGSYTLLVFTADNQKKWWERGGKAESPIRGAPIKLDLVAGAADGSKCSARVEGVKERAGAVLIAVAGREIDAYLDAFDAYGNACSFDADQKVRVDCAGASDLLLREASKKDLKKKKSAINVNEKAFSGTLTKAGSYSMRATVDGKICAGFPKVLQVVANEIDAKTSVLKGDALAEKQVRAGTSAHAIFLANDSFGNARLEGGDNVEIVLKSNDFIDEGLEVDANVEDHADGTYSVRFTLPKSGKWTVHLKCWPDKGEKPEQSVRMSFNSFVTGDAGTKSQDVSNTGVIECLRGKVNALTLKCLESKPMFFVGAETAFTLQSTDFDASHREVGGKEAVCARLLSPSGVSSIIPLKLTKDKIRYRAVVRWPEVGRHTLFANLDGEPLVGSPFTCDVKPAEICLPLSEITGSGRTECVAGKRSSFIIRARDHRGNRLRMGGSPIECVVTSIIKAEDKRVERREDTIVNTEGSVLDQGDGSYVVSYFVDIAGKYEIELVADDSRRSLHGICEAAEADPNRCQIDASGLRNLEAGMVGIARILRCDKFGNVLKAYPDSLPFRVEASGAGPAEIETVEAGDGSCDVRFEARVAGRYTLYVWSGYKRDPVKGAPIEVRVSPGQAAAAHCVATVEGAHDDQGFISSNTNSSITPNVGQINARAGDFLTIKMHARDRFGNATVWKEWQTLEVRASGPRDVRFEEIQSKSSGGGSQIRGQFRSMFSKAGSYVVWVTVGGQAVVGWPRVIHVSPNVTDADQSKMRPEAETLALMSELVTSNQRGNRMLLGAPVRDRGAFGQRTLAGATMAEDEDNVDQLRRETEALKIKLAEYERAAAVVAMAAQKGVEAELKQQQQQQHVVVTKVVKGGGKQQRQLRDIESETEEEE